MIYQLLLYLHSWNRWLVLIFLLLAVVRAFNGWQANKPFSKTDDTINVLLIATLHIQLLLGLLLQFVYSPLTTGLVGDMATVMKDALMRFWVVEHMMAMIIAVIIAQVGRIVAKKKTGIAQHKTLFIFYSIAFLLIFLSIPWGFLHEARPLFRF